MLAARFTGLAQIEEDAWGPIDAMTGLIGGANYPQQARILLGSVGQWISQPFVEAARANTQSPAHRLHLKLATMSFDEFIGPTSRPGTGSAGHLWTLRLVLRA